MVITIMTFLMCVLLFSDLEVIVATCSADRNFNVLRITKSSALLTLLRIVFVLFLIVVIWLLYSGLIHLLQNLNCPTELERAEQVLQGNGEL